MSTAGKTIICISPQISLAVVKAGFLSTGQLCVTGSVPQFSIMETSRFRSTIVIPNYLWQPIKVCALVWLMQPRWHRVLHCSPSLWSPYSGSLRSKAQWCTIVPCPADTHQCCTPWHPNQPLCQGPTERKGQWPACATSQQPWRWLVRPPAGIQAKRMHSEFHIFQTRIRRVVSWEGGT